MTEPVNSIGSSFATGEKSLNESYSVFTRNQNCFLSRQGLVGARDNSFEMGAQAILRRLTNAPTRQIEGEEEQEEEEDITAMTHPRARTWERRT